MRLLLFLVSILLTMNSCSQSNDRSVSFSYDYEGKKLTEKEIQNLANKEIRLIDSIKTSNNEPVLKFEDIKTYISNYEIEATRSNIKDVTYQEDYLYNSFKAGVISKKELIESINTINDYPKKLLLEYFYTKPLESLYGDKDFIDQLINAYNQTDARDRKKEEYQLYVKSVLRYPEYGKLIETAIKSCDYEAKYLPISLGLLLSAYASEHDYEGTMKLLSHVINNLKYGESYGYVPEAQSSVFEILYTKNDVDSIRKDIREILFQYLTKAPIGEVYYHNEIIIDDISVEFKELLITKLNQIELHQDEKKKESKKNDFNRLYLGHYARNHGFNSFSYLDSLLYIPENELEYDANNINYKIKNYKYRDNAHNSIKAIYILVKYCNLDEGQKAEILNSLKKSKLQNALGYNGYLYFFRYYIDIIKEIYPKKDINDFSDIFKTVKKENSKTDVAKYWNERKYYVDSVDYYLDDFQKLGFDVNCSELDILKFKSEYRDRNDNVVIMGMFKLLSNALWYDCETGIVPNDYSSLLSEYLVLCNKHLPEYYPICKYEKTDSKVKYSTIITNGKLGYITTPKDFGDWYDPVTIEAMLNKALLDLRSDKRFIQINTYGQSVLSVFIEPYKLELVSRKYGLELSHKRLSEN